MTRAANAVRGAMDTYIIRIYRYERENPRKLVGLVEEVGADGNRGFTDLDGLWDILNPEKKKREEREKEGLEEHLSE